MGFWDNFVKNPGKALYEEQKQFFNDPLGNIHATGQDFVQGAQDLTEPLDDALGEVNVDEINRQEAIAAANAPAPAPTPEAPAPAPAAGSGTKEVVEEQRRARGRAANILTRGRNLSSQTTTARRTLLGV